MKNPNMGTIIKADKMAGKLGKIKLLVSGISNPIAITRQLKTAILYPIITLGIVTAKDLPSQICLTLTGVAISDSILCLALSIITA